MRAVVLSLVFLGCWAGAAAAVEGQWRGPGRDGVFPEEGLLKEWPDGGPAQVWSTRGVGDGWSSAVVARGRVFVTGTRDKTDHLSALDLDGGLLWQVPIAPAWDQSFPMARCTPTVDDGKVYIISSHGKVMRFDAADGALDWAVDGLQRFGGAYGVWGTAESPLVLEDKVIYTPGGARTTLVALDKESGATVWQSPSLGDTTGYASPIAVDYAGRTMIVAVAAQHVFGVDAADGSLLWKYDYGALDPPDFAMAAAINPVTPLYHEGRIYVTSGYNHVGAMLQLAEDGRSVSLLWKDDTLDCHHGGVVRVGDRIYGANWINNKKGNWCSIDWESGKTLYEEEWISKGSIAYADGMLYCYAEKRGYFGLVRPTDAGFELVSSFQVKEGEGEHWAHPTIAAGMLYLRHGDVLMAYDLRQKDD